MRPAWLAESVTALLRQGISARRLALCVAIGAVVGNIPIFGTSTLLCTFIALAFRLNLPAMQLAQAAMAPTQVLLVIPFLRLGETIVGAPHQTLSSIARPGLTVGRAGISMTGLRDAVAHAGLGWLIVAPLAVWLIYRMLEPLLRRAAGRMTGAQP